MVVVSEGWIPQEWFHRGVLRPFETNKINVVNFLVTKPNYFKSSVLMWDLEPCQWQSKIYLERWWYWIYKYTRHIIIDPLQFNLNACKQSIMCLFFLQSWNLSWLLHASIILLCAAWPSLPCLSYSFIFSNNTSLLCTGKESYPIMASYKHTAFTKIHVQDMDEFFYLKILFIQFTIHC